MKIEEIINYTGTNPKPEGFDGFGSGDWWEKHSWVQQGLAVCAMDCRGHSGLSEDRGGYRGLTWTGQCLQRTASFFRAHNPRYEREQDFLKSWDILISRTLQD